MKETRLAIVPARGGSKRLPGKNIRTFCGKPIIHYSIAAALDTGLFDEVMVSTDDPGIASVAVSGGAVVPFMRGPEASGDISGLEDVVSDVLAAYEGRGRSFAHVCLILATAPFVSHERLAAAYTQLIETDADTVFPVVKYSYPIQRALQFKNGRIWMIWPENDDKRTQDLEDTYHDSGQFYWINTARFREKRKLFTDNTAAIVIPELEAEDIDGEDNFRLAEIKYNAILTSKDSNHKSRF